MPRTSDKRERLLDAAKTLLHQQGYNQTTLADIADASGVPLGNVYYYFKTKDELAAAVIENRRREFAAYYRQWDTNIQEPLARLKQLLTIIRSIAELVTDKGCPVGSLCQELNKNNSLLATQSAQILADQMEWVTRQMELLSKDDAVLQAQKFVAQLQGGILLANTLKDSSYLYHQLEILDAWLDTLTPSVQMIDKQGIEMK